MIADPATAAVPVRRSRSRRSLGAHGSTARKYWPGSPYVAMAMVAIIGVRVHESIPYLRLLRPAVLAMYGGGFLLLVKSSRAALREAVKDRTALLTMVYALWMLVTVPFALWPLQALGTFQGMLPLWILTVAVLLCEPRQQVVRFSTTVFVATVGLLAALTLALGGAGRLGTQGTLDPNDLAAVMAMGLPFAAAIILRERGRRRMAGVLCALLMSVVVIRTESRGGTIAFAVGAVAFTLGFPGRRRVLLLTVAGLAGGAGWFLATPAFRDRMASISSLDQDYNYTEYGGRKQIWERARGYIAEHPVAGLGAGNFGIAEGATARERGQPAVWAATHNAYLQAFAELGVIGGTLFISILITSGRRAWALLRRGAADSAARQPEFIASVCAFASSAYFLSHAYFYTLFVICALTALADRARTADPARPTGQKRMMRRQPWRGAPTPTVSPRV